MARRTYAPQFARMLQRVYKYYAKHQGSINAVATTQQNADAVTIVQAIQSSWNAVPTVEQP